MPQCLLIRLHPAAVRKGLDEVRARGPNIDWQNALALGRSVFRLEDQLATFWGVS